MIELDITIEDFDAYKTYYIRLPCSVKDVICTSHDIQVTEWGLSHPVEFCCDIESLNKVIEDINCENPNMTKDMLEEIMKNTGCKLSDSLFVEKLCSNDFMLEEIDISRKSIDFTSDTHMCAYYLATELEIPFAKNIGHLMSELKLNPASKYDWEVIWECYKKMGFEKIYINNKIYVFNWRSAV